MKSILYSRVGGRREGETPVYKFDWWKVVAGTVVAGLITWGSWVTRMASKAEKTEDYVDMQVLVIHGRITKVDDRINEVIWRFFEDEVKDCEEDRDGQTDQSECVQTP